MTARHPALPTKLEQRWAARVPSPQALAPGPGGWDNDATAAKHPDRRRARPAHARFARTAPMPTASEFFRQLPSAEWDQLDRLLKDFEAALKRGERPPLNDYLPAAHPHRPRLLAELAQL